MKNILLFGAGKSATVLIDYLLANAPRQKWHITVADNDLMLIKSKIGKSYYATPAACVTSKTRLPRQQLIQETDLVISFSLPRCTSLSPKIACSPAKPPYRFLHRSRDTQAGKDIKKAGLLFMYEMGLDPGIDHMSAMKLIHSIERKAGRSTVLNNPAGPRFPRKQRTTLAVQDLLELPEYRTGRHFRRHLQRKGKGEGSGLPAAVRPGTRPYRSPALASLPITRTAIRWVMWTCTTSATSPLFMRATLRYPDFCEGWNALIKLGLTDDSEETADE